MMKRKDTTNEITEGENPKVISIDRHQFFYNMKLHWKCVEKWVQRKEVGTLQNIFRRLNKRSQQTSSTMRSPEREKSAPLTRMAAALRLLLYTAPA